MFTGIIEEVGKVKSVEKQGASGRITIECSFKPDALKIGDSIAVNGVCLTVTDFKQGHGGVFTADISGETLDRTNLGELKKGSPVNLESPLTPLKPIGGHIVTGHIDCVGTLKNKAMEQGNGAVIEVTVPDEFLRLVVYKGSIAVDGVSLTVAALTDNGFKAALIPHTLKQTTFAVKATGGAVNIETDIIGKYVARMLMAYKKTGVTEEFLSEHGFLKGD